MTIISRAVTQFEVLFLVIDWALLPTTDYWHRLPDVAPDLFIQPPHLSILQEAHWTRRHVWPLPSIPTQATDPGVFRHNRRGRLGTAVQHRTIAERWDHSSGPGEARTSFLAGTLGPDPVLGERSGHRL